MFSRGPTGAIGAFAQSPIGESPMVGISAACPRYFPAAPRISPDPAGGSVFEDGIKKLMSKGDGNVTQSL
jgi:hypothetical protein